MSGAPPSIEVNGLDFRYPADGSDRPLVLDDVRLSVPAGARCLLVGANGAGKTTRSQVLAGRYLVDPSHVRVLARPAFHDTSLSQRVAFLGGKFPFDVDVAVHEVLARLTGLDSVRRDRLLAILGVDPAWRMHRVSDGQRRRVQILLGLLRPSELLLLDEVTTDLDVIARADLLAFLRDESQAHGLTILYATHIFDGLDVWATHLAHLARGRIRSLPPIDQIPELARLRAAGASSPLLRLVEGWLREL